MKKLGRSSTIFFVKKKQLQKKSRIFTVIFKTNVKPQKPEL